uniref:NodB homology domain-containing protein n=1 Tax=Odontella aurita TaxID=265563 RepID=A0A7S4N5M4_9STRA|mmetsp:Transcript_48935/g.147419  ORF Transcript_48935/g.147419 Transcript_48935/m.147419 type:complete len:419 (+) Transcript_48935:52-1308(+)
MRLFSLYVLVASSLQSRAHGDSFAFQSCRQTPDQLLHAEKGRRPVPLRIVGCRASLPSWLGCGSEEEAVDSHDVNRSEIGLRAMGNVVAASTVVQLHKLGWSVLTFVGIRRLVSLIRFLFPWYRDTVFYFKVEGDDLATKIPSDGRIVLTIDDGLSRSGCSTSMVDDLLRLLAKYNARATFFPCTEYCSIDHESRKALRDLVRIHGHDVGNHCSEDVSGFYSRMSEDEFSRELEKSNRVLESIINDDGSSGGSTSVVSDGAITGSDDGHDPPCTNPDGGRRAQFSVKFFRAPQGLLTRPMRRSVSSAKMVHVLGDVYADDWALAPHDPAFVARTMLRQVRDGSIVICHMPDCAVGRERCLDALAMLLEGLEQRGLKVVSLADMWEACGGQHAHSPKDMQRKYLSQKHTAPVESLGPPR